MHATVVLGLEEGLQRMGCSAHAMKMSFESSFMFYLSANYLLNAYTDILTLPKFSCQWVKLPF